MTTSGPVGVAGPKGDQLERLRRVRRHRVGSGFGGSSSSDEAMPAGVRPASRVAIGTRRPSASPTIETISTAARESPPRSKKSEWRSTSSRSRTARHDESDDGRESAPAATDLGRRGCRGFRSEREYGGGGAVDLAVAVARQVLVADEATRERSGWAVAAARLARSPCSSSASASMWATSIGGSAQATTTASWTSGQRRSSISTSPGSSRFPPTFSWSSTRPTNSTRSTVDPYEIAGAVPPSAVDFEEALGVGAGIVEVSAGHPGPGDQQLAGDAVGHRRQAIVDHADRGARDRPADGHGVVSRRSAGAPSPRRWPRSGRTR